MKSRSLVYALYNTACQIDPNGSFACLSLRELSQVFVKYAFLNACKRTKVFNRPESRRIAELIPLLIPKRQKRDGDCRRRAR